ncbi:MAG: hypothetical protein EOP49_42420, partial [Sphingobacteriales bacterium]
FQYNPIVNEVEGIVTYKAAPFAGTRITAKVNPGDIVDGSTVTNFESVSDNSGYYRFADLPALKRNAPITLTAIERRVQDQPITAELKTNGTPLLSKNFDFVFKEKKNGVVTIQGRVQEKTLTNRLIDLSVGGIVRLAGTNISAPIMPGGWFIIKVPYPINGKVIASAEGFQDQEVNWYYAMSSSYPAKEGAYSYENWANNVQNVSDFYRFMQSSQMASKLGIGNGKLSDVARTYFSPDEEIKQIMASQVTGLSRAPQGNMTFSFQLDPNFDKSRNMVAGRVWVDGVEVHPAEAGKNWVYSGTPGKHTFKIEPVKGGATFFGQTGEFSLLDQLFGVLTTTVYLSPATMISGVVKDDVSGKVVEGATVSVDGLNYEVLTNSKGEYQLLLPNNKEYKIAVLKPSYEATSQVRVVTESQ